MIPTNIEAGTPGSIFTAPVVYTILAGGTQLIPAGVHYLYLTGADVDLEIITATVPTWTKIRDGDAAVLGTLVISDGVSVRLRNTHGSATEAGSLITIRSE